jgi:hypothetical protein
MLYMLIHTANPDVAADWDENENWASFSAWVEETIRAGVSLQGSRVRPTADATTIKIRDGELIITDGPYAETREQLAGYDVLECASLDEAVRWAGRHPHSRLGSIEVRALPDGAPAVPLPEPGEGKIQYLMLVCTDPAVDAREFARIEPVDPWVAETNGRGVRRYGSELEPPASARTVRVRESRAIVTDGPFAETKEQIAGFDVLECADLDEAIEVASRHPMARLGILEVRPFWPFKED